MEGYMEKRGSVNKSFKLRYFRLHDAAPEAARRSVGQTARLEYFGSPSDATPKGSVELRFGDGRYRVLPQPTAVKGDRAAEQWAVRTPEREYVFRCGTADERERWMLATRTVLFGRRRPHLERFADLEALLQDESVPRENKKEALQAAAVAFREAVSGGGGGGGGGESDDLGAVVVEEERGLLQYYLGFVLFQLGSDDEGARYNLEAAVRACPDEPRCRETLADLLQYSGEPETATALLKEAVGIAERLAAEGRGLGPSSSVLYELGMVRLRAGDLAAGFKWLERAYQANESSPATLFQLGCLLMDARLPDRPEGSEKRAEELLLRAACLDPQLTLAWLNLGKLEQLRFTESGTRRAIEHFLRALDSLEAKDPAEVRDTDVQAMSMVVQCASFLGDDHLRDEYRAKIIELHRAGGTDCDRFCCAQFTVPGAKVMVHELLSFKEGYNCTFVFTASSAADGTDLFSLALTSYRPDQEAARAAGLLGAGEGERAHVWYLYPSEGAGAVTRKRRMGSFVASGAVAFGTVRPMAVRTIVREVRALGLAGDDDEADDIGTVPPRADDDVAVQAELRQSCAELSSARFGMSDLLRLERSTGAPESASAPAPPSEDAETGAYESLDEGGDGYEYQSYFELKEEEEGAEVVGGEMDTSPAEARRRALAAAEAAAEAFYRADDGGDKVAGVAALDAMAARVTARAGKPDNGTAVQEAPGPADSRRAWNEEYQSLFEAVPGNLSEAAAREARMRELVAAFVLEAQSAARRIVAEEGLPADRRSVPLLDGAGGVAGGEKFLHKGSILLKYARDTAGLYCGDDSLAAKVAANEVRSMNAAVDADVPCLHTTLSCLVMHAGRALFATAVAPLSKSTLVYGSCDAARTVSNSSPAMRELFRQLADTLNLRPHAVGSPPVVVHTGVDVEGHCARGDGGDGRFYAVDLARLLPCMPPRALGAGAGTAARAAFRPDYLTRLFRPEFLRARCGARPLSSDAFSAFGRADAAAHNGDVVAARSFYDERLVPAAARRLDAFDDPALHPAVRRSVSVSAELHALGVSVGDLGAVRARMSSAAMRRRVLFELVARALKVRFRQWLRAAPASAAAGLAPPLAAALLRALFFGGNDGGRGAWAAAFALVRVKFGRFGAADAADPGREEVAAVRELESLARSAQLEHQTTGACPEAGVLAGVLLEQLGLVPGGGATPLGAVLRLAEPMGHRHLCYNATVKEVRSAAMPRRMADAERRARRELALREAALGSRTSPSLLGALWGLVAVFRLWSQAEPREALERAEETAERIRLIREEALDGGGPDPAPQFYNELGQLYMTFGREADALRAYSKHAAEVEAGSGPAAHANYAAALNNVGNALNMSGRHAEARDTLERALAVCEGVPEAERPNRALLAQVLTNLSVAYAELAAATAEAGAERDAHLAAQRRHLERAVEVERASSGGADIPTPQLGVALSELATNYLIMRDWAGAKRVCMEAIASKRKSHGEGHVSVAITEGNLSVALHELGEREAAVAAARHAAGIMLERLGAGHPDCARVSGQMATYLVDVPGFVAEADAREAREAVVRAVQATEAAYGPSHARNLPVLRTAIEVAAKVGDAALRRACLERAAALARGGEAAEMRGELDRMRRQ